MLYLFGTTDPKVVDTCRVLLRPGDCFLDIGANYGAVGLLCSKAVGNDGVVHLFEPQPELCERVRTAIAEHGLDHVRLHEVGLMDRDDVIDMVRPRAHWGSASFVLNRTCHRSVETLRLRVKNIATYLPPLIGDRSFSAKIDVEGAERHLLPWLFQQTRLRFVVFESVHLEEVDLLFDAIAEAGFVLFGLRKTLLRTRLQRITAPQHARHYHDLAAVRIDPAVALPDWVSPGQLRSFLLDEQTDSVLAGVRSCPTASPV
ncbi:MAG: FkbM family methyltransferase [Phycisphaerae bacterium]